MMKLRTCRVTLAFLTVVVLLASNIPASVAQSSPILINLWGSAAPQHGLNVTFYRQAPGTSLTPGMGRLLIPFDFNKPMDDPKIIDPEGNATIVKTDLWTSGTNFTQAALTQWSLYDSTWTGLTNEYWVQVEGYLWVPKNHDLSAYGDLLGFSGI